MSPAGPIPTKPTKAIVAGVVALAGAIVAGTVPVPTWLTAIATAIVAVGSVYQVENTPRDGGRHAQNPKPEPAD